MSLSHPTIPEPLSGPQAYGKLASNEACATPSALQPQGIVAQPSGTLILNDVNPHSPLINEADIDPHLLRSFERTTTNAGASSPEAVPNMGNSSNSSFPIPEEPGVASLIHSMAQKDLRNSADRVAVLAAAKEIVNELQDPVERAFELTFSFPTLPCLSIAVDLGIFVMLSNNEAMTSQDICRATGAEEEFIVRIMRVLISNGVVQLRGPRLYAATPVSNCFATPTIAAGVSVCIDQGSPACTRLPEWARAHKYRNPTDPLNSPYQHAFNTFDTWWSWLSTRPRQAANFNTYVSGFREARASSPWCKIFPAEDVIFNGLSPAQQNNVTVVDIGGGLGHDMELLRNTFSRKPARLVVQDLPTVIDTALATQGIEFQTHDFMTPQPVRGARAYVLKHILHDWPHAHAVNILRNIKTAMMPGYSLIFILDLVVPETKVPIAAAAVDMVMMSGFAGTERGEELWKDVIREAGLTLKRVWKQGDGDGMLVVGLDTEVRAANSGKTPLDDTLTPVLWSRAKL